MVRKIVYMDYQSTTPVDERVANAMAPYFSERFGNAASRYHEQGWVAEAAIEHARKMIARLIGAEENEKNSEITFTSGATESNNLALKGIAESYKDSGRHIITAKTEHSSVIDTCRFLEESGFEITYLPVDSEGRLNPIQLARAIRPDTILVSIMSANNEVGTLHPIAELGKICRSSKVLFHVDAVQSLGSLPVDVEEWNVDLLSMSAHKMYGPKGVGALYVRRRRVWDDRPIRLQPQIHGGGHERGLRSGTLNVPGIVGFGKAAELSMILSEAQRIEQLRDQLWEGLKTKISNIYLNGSLEHRLPGNLNVSIDGVDAEPLMMSMKDVAISSGAACATANSEPSHVLRAMGLSDERAASSVRLSLGRFSTEADVLYVTDRLSNVVAELRSLATGTREVQNYNSGRTYDSIV